MPRGSIVSIEIPQTGAWWMKIELAFIELQGGTKAILRGAPERVEEAFERGSHDAGGGEILFRVSGRATSEAEEDQLWREFLQASQLFRRVGISVDMYQVWRHNADTLWSIITATAPLCFFVEGESGDNLMLLVAEGQEILPYLHRTNSPLN